MLTILILRTLAKIGQVMVKFDNILAVHDSEINDGSPERPYYMPVGLMEIVGRRNKQ